MRGYLRRRCQEQPAWAIWQRAKKRASRLGLEFDLPLSEVVVPSTCPVMGTPLILGEGRSPHSPSLDRINPSRGYITGNCRVISDHANRIKSKWNLKSLQLRAASGNHAFRDDYAKLARYVEREELLVLVRERARRGGRVGLVWTEIADFMEDRFRRGLVD